MKDRIKTLRNALNLTQQQFAEKIGVSRSTIANIETGKKVPSDLIINAICSEYSVNKEWLCTGQGEMFLSKPDAMIAENFKQKQISKISKLSDAQLVVLAQIAEGFCNGSNSDN